ncbi:MAG: hypothetical protein M8354_03135 [Halalkalicoccus sp.]|nr:hypothetical protein [Halalkalicoccus sp.]
MTNEEARVDPERTSRTSRRSYLGALAGAAAVPVFGSVASADSERVITVVGRGSTAHYEFSVSGDVEKSTAHDGTINSFDAIDESRVTGRTTHEADSFAFTGEISGFEADAPVDVSIDGETVDPAAFGEAAHVVSVTGRGSTAHYDLTIDGSVEKSTAYGGTINTYDAIDRSTVTGRTTHETDSFAFTGEIADFEADAPVDLTLDGEPADLGGGVQATSTDDEDEDSEVDESAYSTVVNIVEAGADNDGDESITSTLEQVAGDDTLVKFPPGEYLVDGQFRIAGYEKFGMVGEDATIHVAPTDGYTFKLGTYRSPIDDLTVEGFTADISGDNTGGRVFELQAGESLSARNLTVEGKHDTPSKGPVLVGLQSSDGEGLVENVDLSDGGEEVSGGRGGTGLLVSNYHEGTVTLRDIQIGPFPDNGIYCSNKRGTVHVEGGHVENANVAGVRLRGDGSSIEGTEFVYDEHFDGFGGQRPIRLDGGSNLEVSNVEIDMSIDQTEAIRVMPEVDSASIHDVDMDLSSSVRDGVSITGGAGSVETDDLSVSGNSRYTVFEY